MKPSSRGFSAPILLILTLAFLVIPFYLWSKANPPGGKSNIRGASSISSAVNKTGFSVSVVADSSTWDLVEYLCETKTQCLESINSGRRLETVSGGETDLHEVFVAYAPEWDSYDYVKFYVRSGWYSRSQPFRVVSTDPQGLSEVYTLSDGTNDYEAVLLPTKALKDSFVDGLSFSDR